MRLLHVTYGDAGVERGGDERVADDVWADWPVHSRAAAVHGPRGTVAIHPLPVHA